MKLYTTIFFLLTLLASCQQADKQQEPLFLSPLNTTLSQVDPFIGTGGHGHTYPGATLPFGMVQLSPDNGTQGWDWCSGYNYADSVIVGFSHTHLSGTGIGDLCDISVMPAIGVIDLLKDPKKHKEKDYAYQFSHENERAFPGYYGVKFDNGIKAELTTSTRAGMHRYTFPEDAEASVLIDLGFEINWDKTLASSMEINGNTVTGHRLSTGWAKDQRVYFAAEFSVPVVSYESVIDSASAKASKLEGKRVLTRFYFGKETRQIMLKVGISSASVEGAKASLTEIDGWDFDSTVTKAQEIWTKELEKVRFESADPALGRTFYTALYHTMLAPVIFDDPNGEYKGPDGNVHKTNIDRYDIFSLWDTFRAENPLFTILHKDRVNSMISSLLDHYDTYGLLPVWSLLGNETNTMTGYHAVPVIADAILKGFDGFDVGKAYEAMKKSSMQDIRGSDLYRQFGYIPYELQGQSVTKTLEYAYDDWCIAMVARKLGKNEEAEIYEKRAQNYRNLFDSSTGFMRAKLKDGSWKQPFDPFYSDHNFEVAEYTEGNAWQHSFFVPHDVSGLIELHGGAERFINMLDSLFTVDSEVSGENVSADISGLIGQYAHGNEPSHHIAYMYNYAGAPWKTQAMVDEIMRTQYNDTPLGLCGNEDCGQMSAWYVFSALGFYPVNPSVQVFFIGRPMMDKAVVSLDNNKTLEINVKGNSTDNKYIQSVNLNGVTLARSYLLYAELMAGGTLEIEMGSQPNTSWAAGTELYKSLKGF